MTLDEAKEVAEQVLSGATHDVHAARRLAVFVQTLVSVRKHLPRESAQDPRTVTENAKATSD